MLTEPRTVRLGERDLPYLLKRSAQRRRLVLLVDERGLVVHVPWRASERHVAQAIAEAQSWILRKLAEWERKKPRQRSWIGGEALDFLGRQLTLQLHARDGPAIAQLRDGSALELSLAAPHTPERVRNAVVSWYRRHAGSHFAERVQHFCARLDVPAPCVLLSSARTRWGSCNADGEIRLNWRLMQAAGSVIDYVVAHEVAHLKVMSHSTRFWRTVQRLCPDYEAAKAELSAMSLHFMAL
jgi:predicted metal-dependent hydrolase